MPNIVATAALVLWPLITVALFLRLPPGRAVVATILAGYLLLPPGPAALDLPLMPDLGKEELPALVAFLLVLILWRPGLALLPRSPLLRGLILLHLLVPLGSMITNPEPLAYGPLVLPGLGLRDAGQAIVLRAIHLMPFLLARHFLTRPEDRRDLILALMIGGLAYSLPILAEVRLSPQINTWVYGFFQHSFEQMMRAGGFRPIVFLNHALWVAFFMMSAVVAAAALARDSSGPTRAAALLVTGWLALVLLAGKSYAAIFYAGLLVPVVLLAPVRLQLHLAALLVAVALVWPLARAADLVPVEHIVSMAGWLGPDRAHTLAFRFDNETVLTLHALDKPLFGWGQWGRNQLYSEQTGRMLSVTDGRWVLVLGTWGLAGLVSEFGLLALPVLIAWRHRNRIAQGGGASTTAALALVLGANMFDLIPNAIVTPLTWLMAGTILAAMQQPQLQPAQPVSSSRGGSQAVASVL